MELPRTGTVSLSKELRHKYHGNTIYQKHTTYSKFLSKASSEGKNILLFLAYEITWIEQ